jgi:glutathione synthase/RimK-type ligase-like ATP-grasp enzyme
MKMTERKDVDQAGAAGFSFFALPDKGQIQVMINEAGQLEFGRRNVLSFPGESAAYLAETAPEIWYPQLETAFPAKPKWIINKCTDPDTYAHALRWLEDRYGADATIFNHPEAIRHTSRDRLPKRLAGIRNLVCPPCVRLQFENETDLQRTFRKNRFNYPVLVRPAELQAGRGLKRVNDDDQWSELLYSEWFRQDHFMTQFVDSKTEEDAYLKVRVLYIGGKPFLRHVKASSNWLVHNSRREEVAGFPDREMQFIQELEANADFMQVCTDVAERLPLDYFGMDIGVDLHRNYFVLFEANPSMNVFFPERASLSEAAMARREKLQQRAAHHLEKVLRDPELWAHRRGLVGR